MEHTVERKNRLEISRKGRDESSPVESSRICEDVKSIEKGTLLN